MPSYNTSRGIGDNSEIYFAISAFIKQMWISIRTPKVIPTIKYTQNMYNGDLKKP